MDELQAFVAELIGLYERSDGMLEEEICGDSYATDARVEELRARAMVVLGKVAQNEASLEQVIDGELADPEFAEAYVRILRAEIAAKDAEIESLKAEVADLCHTIERLQELADLS